MVYTSYSEIEAAQAPVTSALKVMADARITLIEADLRARALWKKLSRNDIALPSIAHAPQTHSLPSVWQRAAKNVENSGCDGIHKIVEFNYFNVHGMPSWKSDDELTNGATAKDRRIFMEIIAEAEDFNTILKGYQHATQTANTALQNLQEWCELDPARYHGMYVIATTSRRTVTGWVINTTPSTIVVEEDRAQNVNGAWTAGWATSPTAVIYQPNTWVQSFNSWEHREEERKKSEYRFNVERTKIVVLLTRELTYARRRQCSSWLTGYRKAKAEVAGSVDFKNMLEWLESGGGKAAQIRKRAIDNFDWNQKITTDPERYYYSSEEHKLWIKACGEVLKTHGLFDEALALTKEKIFLRETGGWLTPAEEEILNKKPDVPYQDWLSATMYYFEKLGVVDPTKTIF